MIQTGALRTSPPTRITRCRTGCITCRRRRKKCDERKPTCVNCERNSFICEGYQDRIQWVPPNKITIHRQSNSTSSASYPSPGDEDANTDSLPTRRPQRKSLPFVSERSPRLSLPSICLPSLITGVESPLERRLFLHFSSIMAPTLVLNDSCKNPLTNALMQIALSSRGVLRLICGLSACHLVRVLKMSGISGDTSDYRKLQRAQLELYGESIRFHSSTIAPLLSNKRPPRIATEVDMCTWKLAFATSMLLCQYDTCEGGAKGLWRHHLTAAHQILRYTEQATESGILLDSSFSVLREWYLYHQGISQIFSDGSGIGNEEDVSILSRKDNSSHVQNVDDYILVGLRDGLLGFIAEISKLRRRSRTLRQLNGTSGIDIELLSLGMEINADLQSWDYHYTSEQHKVVAECYRWAAFIILCSTIYENSFISDDKVQAAVRGGLAWLENLSSNNNAQTCCLFPIFVIGIAAVELEDRNLLLEKITAYRLWSGLGNADETASFLQSWWDRRSTEGNNVNWWDWQEYSKELGITIAVV